MTVKELFSCLNTVTPSISIYDFKENIVWEKSSEKPIGHFPFWEKQVAWISRVDNAEIIIKIH